MSNKSLDGVIQKDRRSIAFQLRDRIRSMLKEKYYRAGDRLPSEENLVEIFGASRATIREALKLHEEEKTIIYVYVLQRACKTVGETVIFSIDIFRYSIVKGEIDKNSFQSSLLAIMENRWGRRLAYARAVISAEQLTADLCRKIQEYTGAKWIVMEQVNYDKNDFPSCIPEITTVGINSGFSSSADGDKHRSWLKSS